MLSHDNKLIFKNEEDIYATNYDVGSIIKLEEKGLLRFVVPERYKTNSEKAIYKSGFLMVFLKYIYPSKNTSDINKIIIDRYQVFLTWRQLLRNLKKYKEL